MDDSSSSVTAPVILLAECAFSITTTCCISSVVFPVIVGFQISIVNRNSIPIARNILILGFIVILFFL